jgi:hypothetical protein
MGRRFTCGTEAKFIWARGRQVQPRCSAALARRDNVVEKPAPHSRRRASVGENIELSGGVFLQSA